MEALDKNRVLLLLITGITHRLYIAAFDSGLQERSKARERRYSL